MSTFRTPTSLTLREVHEDRIELENDNLRWRVRVGSLSFRDISNILLRRMFSELMRLVVDRVGENIIRKDGHVFSRP